ncbi:hypothetical protein FJB87_20685 [Salmonella enterica subsp. enterica]|uniref:hypothetical protein n=1 Tax=Salmonella enterica TaxID=28901 RepID=UPI00107A0870|nr:hypothetical protein [Salmonella enterica]EAB6708050.1 hypothetical protein [Salmonella enterica subsp. enterica serovar Brandenburg]EBG6822392.1 hypothetical protein [Salmonella enterica subsp. enterica]EBY2673371.1 hypothetical protein [Salmonella enterica subsp. enterica serovar Schwarzengrund]EGP2908412.1 hypothetical protein [Salmonella enterica subsp. enterica serovar Muenster]EBG6926421.1 hypothetical protein [Salmonella enterica subsp. enterica]
MIHSLTRNVLVIAVCLLAGCGSDLTGLSGQINTKKKSVVGEVQKSGKSGGKVVPSLTTSPVGRIDASADSSASITSDLSVERCGRELNTLKRLDIKRYTQRKFQFDRLMAGASVYADVRSDVVKGTQEAVDAMYRFRVGKLCAEISRDVLDALTRQSVVSQEQRIINSREQ